MKSRPRSSKDNGSGGQGHSGGYSNHEVFLYDGVGVGDGLDDLDGTLQKKEECSQRFQAQLRAYNAKRASRQGLVVETNPGGVSDAPSEGREGNSSLRSSNGGGGRGGSDSGNNTVGNRNESTPTSPSSPDGGEGTGGGREGESAPSSTRHPTPHPRQIAGRELPRWFFPEGTGATWSGWKDCLKGLPGGRVEKREQARCSTNWNL